MTWILILTTLYVGHSAHTTTQEFKTKEACIAAEKIVKGDYNSGVIIDTACVEKGERK